MTLVRVYKMSVPKYGLGFLLFIIIAKISYLFLEVYYNGYLIEVITNNSVTPALLEELNALGHNVSSIGLTLLLTPLVYLLARKFITFPKAIPVVIVSFMLLSFFTFHSLLTTLMEKVVDNYKEKRYSSYYVSTFKYAMLNGALGYETFMPRENLKNFDVLDRVLVANMFLLNYIDDSLIDKLIDRGQEQFIDVFILKYSFTDYDKSRKSFENRVKEITTYYNDYLAKSKSINKKFSSMDTDVIVSKMYAQFTKNLAKQYKNYEKAVIRYEESIDVDDLQKYAVLEKKALRKFHLKYKGLPTDLSARAFYNHKIVKKLTIKKLKKHGLYVSNNFNYSKAAFAKAYKSKINRAFVKEKKQFYKQLKKTTGKNLSFGLSYSQFAYRFKNDFEAEFGKKYSKVAYQMLINRDSSEFYEKLYKPHFTENYLDKYLLSRADFEEDKNAKIGDGAIKHLYVPPFAITISLLTGILNFISVVGFLVFMFLKLHVSSTRVFFAKSIFKLTLLAAFYFYPYYEVSELHILQKYQALEKLQADEETAPYVKVLEWVMVYEKITYETLYPPLKTFKYLFETSENHDFREAT